MTDEVRLEIKRRLERQLQANTATVQAARESLVRKGIYTEAGQLTPEYGGETKKRGQTTA